MLDIIGFFAPVAIIIAVAIFLLTGGSRKVLAIIGWLLPPVLTIAGLCVDSKYIKFYANQQLWVLLSGIIALVIPVVGWVIGIIGFVFEIIGFIGICTNKAKRMPFLGKIDIIKWDK